MLTRYSRKLWDSEAVRGSPPSVAYDNIMKGDGVADWTQQINEFGFSFVKGCPIDGQATRELLEKIGPIRETHYGESKLGDHLDLKISNRI